MSVDLSAPEAEEVSPQEAWKMLKEMRGTKLVDVRTVPEWLYVGLPEIEATEGALLKSLARVSGYDDECCVYPRPETCRVFG